MIPFRSDSSRSPSRYPSAACDEFPDQSGLRGPAHVVARVRWVGRIDVFADVGQAERTVRLAGQFADLPPDLPLPDYRVGDRDRLPIRERLVEPEFAED